MAELERRRKSLHDQLHGLAASSKPTYKEALLKENPAARGVSVLGPSVPIRAAAAAIPAAGHVNTPLMTTPPLAEREQRKQLVLQWFESNRNQSTKRTYASGWTGFLKYLERIRVPLASITEWEVADYFRERVEEQGVAAATVNGDRSAILDHLKHTNQAALLDHPLVTKMLIALKNKAVQSKPKQHMSAELMKDIIANHDDQAAPSWLEERNVCLLLLMMMGMLRESEAVALTLSDVVIKEEEIQGERIQTLQLGIVQSKTDQAKLGHVVLLGSNAKCASFCPVSRFEKYQAARASAHAPVSEMVFPTQAGSAMSSSTPCGIVQRAVEAANKRAVERGEAADAWGEPAEYGSHSMRRGGVTVARENGVSMLDIQRHGRWKSLVVYNYVGATAHEQAAVTSSFLRRGDSKAEKKAGADGDMLLTRAAQGLLGTAALAQERTAKKNEKEMEEEAISSPALAAGRRGTSSGSGPGEEKKKKRRKRKDAGIRRGPKTNAASAAREKVEPGETSSDEESTEREKEEERMEEMLLDELTQEPMEEESPRKKQRTTRASTVRGVAGMEKKKEGRKKEEAKDKRKREAVLLRA